MPEDDEMDIPSKLKLNFDEDDDEHMNNDYIDAEDDDNLNELGEDDEDAQIDKIAESYARRTTERGGRQKK
jgi:hypothetical protein